MELTNTPDTYEPVLDALRNYVDKVPTIGAFKHGINCPCTKRTYASATQFGSHIRTDVHRRWLIEVNGRKDSQLAENTRLVKLVEDQRRKIAEMDIEISQLKTTVVYLSGFVAKTPVEATKTGNLLNLLD